MDIKQIYSYIHTHTCIHIHMNAGRALASLIDLTTISTQQIRESVCAKHLFPASFVENVLHGRVNGGEGWARHCVLHEGISIGGFGNDEGL